MVVFASVLVKYCLLPMNNLATHSLELTATPDFVFQDVMRVDISRVKQRTRIL